MHDGARRKSSGNHVPLVVDDSVVTVIHYNKIQI